MMDIPSPCQQRCRLDPEWSDPLAPDGAALCQACLRRLDEIMAWPQADTDQRLTILSRLHRRRQQLDPWGEELRGECER